MFDFTFSNCIDLWRLVIVFENNTATYFFYITMVLGQPAGLSKEVCLYADSDWLKLISVRGWPEVVTIALFNSSSNLCITVNLPR